MFEAKSRAELLAFLQEKVPLFERFTPENLEDIIHLSQRRTFEGNESIIECGQPGRFLIVLESGQAQVTVTGDTGEQIQIAALQPGDICGEMSIMTGDRTVADVIAVTRCYTLMIPEKVVNEHVLTEPRAVLHLSRLLAARTRELAENISSAQMQARALARAKDPYALSLKTDTPGKIMSLNVGYRKTHFGVFDTHDSSLDVKGHIEQSDGQARILVEAGGKPHVLERAAFGFDEFFQALFEAMRPLADKYLFTPFDVIAVGHRVVHGGNRFSCAEVITEEVLKEIERLSVFAPQHQPNNLEGIRVTMQLMPDIPHVAVFDTAFHHTLPTYAYLYGLPYTWYKQKGIRRYGFHGTSHRYVSLKSAEVAKRPLGELEIVSCYLDSGASLCAIDHGRSVDNSMGMTPTDGLIMTSRSGSLDPMVVIHLMEQHQMSPDQLRELINTQSGMQGISGIAGTLKEIEAAAEEGQHRALLAHKAYCYQIRKNIGAYVAAMGGIDVLAFTGSIGENSALVRSLACQGLAYMGIRLDEEKNRNPDLHDGYAIISADDSPVQILIVANDDERLLAWEALRAIERNEITLELKAHDDLPIPIEVSAHHVHLSQADVDKLFGQGHQLTPEHELSQPGQFACAEKVDLVGPKGRIANVRVLGPTRKETQVEIAMTEQFKLGVTAPIRESGDIAGTPGLTLVGSAGSAVIERGVICAQRHIHMSPEDAMRLRVRDKYVVKVRVPGERELVFGDVVVRVNPNYRLAMHIDTDEGNAANLHTGMEGFIEGIQNRA